MQTHLAKMNASADDIIATAVASKAELAARITKQRHAMACVKDAFDEV